MSNIHSSSVFSFILEKDLIATTAAFANKTGGSHPVKKCQVSIWIPVFIFWFSLQIFRSNVETYILLKNLRVYKKMIGITGTDVEIIEW